METVTFESMAEMIDHCEQAKPASPNNSSCRVACATGNKAWMGSASIEEANRLAFRWDDGAARIQRVRGIISEAVASLGFDYYSRPIPPGALNMARYLDGHPMPYVGRKPNDDVVAGRNKVVRVVVNVAVSAGIDTDVIERRGAAVLSLVDALESAGRTTEIVTVMASSRGKGPASDAGSKFEIRTTVKRAGEPLNLSSIAYALAHPSMMRRHMHRVMEIHPSWRELGVGGGYAMPCQATCDPEDIYLGCMFGADAQWSSEASAARWVVAELKRQGIDFGE